MEIPSSYRLTFTAEQIAARIKELGAEITPWAQEAFKRTGKQVLGVCILRGGALFFSDLLRAIDVTVEPTFCRTWSYSSAVNIQERGGVRVSVDDVVAEGRAILMIDDICDTGATLLKLKNVFMDLGAGEVRSAVLVHRRAEDPKFQPTWSAFPYAGSEWFVGYGMEDKNSYSNLPSVYTTKPVA